MYTNRHLLFVKEYCCYWIVCVTNELLMRWTPGRQQHVSFFSLIKKQSLNSNVHIYIFYIQETYTRVYICYIYPNEYYGKSIDLKSWNPCEEGHTSWEKEAKKTRWIILLLLHSMNVFLHHRNATHKIYT